MSMPPPFRSDLAGLQAALAAQRRDGTGASRVGSVILEWRPSFQIDAIPTAGLSPSLAQFDGAAPGHDLAGAAQTAGSAVGQVMGGGRLLGTCFRVGPKCGRLVGTAAHLWPGLAAGRARLREALPARIMGSLNDVRVGFGPAGTDGDFKVVEVRACHSRWDLMVLRLDEGDLLPDPLVIETALDWAEAAEAPVIVLGYPGLQGPEASSEVAKAIFTGGDGLYVSPGLLKGPPVADPVPPLQDNFDPKAVNYYHEASTLPGFSGGPVVSLATGKVVGIHIQGGELENMGPHEEVDFEQIVPNAAVNLPLACREERLRALMVEGRTREEIAAIKAIDWRPPVTNWARGLRDENTVEDAWASTAQDVTEPPFAGIEPDRPDFRDYVYRIGLVPLPDRLDPPAIERRAIRAQGRANACTGFALANAIDRQLAFLDRRGGPVSARMLYECARAHDEWIERRSGGSSLRGAIKGFYQNGVCSERAAPWDPGERGWWLTRDRSREARSVTLGAYFRVPPDLLAFQAALVEARAVIVSAHIHKGWRSPSGKKPSRIRHSPTRVGTHAFVLLGYDEKGFIVLNSWGPDWGAEGLAHWSYEDWAENLIDAWVLRLAPSQPDTFDLRPRSAGPASVPRRHSLIGHFVQSETDGFVRNGPTGGGLESLRETALWLATPEARETGRARGKVAKGYRMITFVLLDPFLGAEANARIAARLIPAFKALQPRIYPIHVLHGSREADTIRLRVLTDAASAAERYSADPDALSLYTVRRARAATRSLWDTFLAGLSVVAGPGGPVWTAIRSVAEEAGEGRRLGLLAVGAGAELALALHRSGLLMDLHFERPVFVGPTLLHAQLKDDLGGKVIPRQPSERQPTMVVPGFPGDWPDLIVSAYRDGDEAPPAPLIPLADAFENESFLKRLVKEVRAT